MYVLLGSYFYYKLSENIQILVQNIKNHNIEINIIKIILLPGAEYFLNIRIFLSRIMIDKAVITSGEMRLHGEASGSPELQAIFVPAP